MKKLGIDQVKKIQLEILSAVDEWCRGHHVGYFLDCGTLLGAVRHKGYIPWDDDIDISMLRPEYEFFIENFNKDRTDDFRVLHFSKDEAFPYEFAKIHDQKTLLVEQTGCHYDYGVNIDLFVVDEAADDYETAVRRAKKLYWKLRFPFFVFSWKLTVSNRERKRPFYKAVVVSLMKWATSLFSVGWCTKRIDKLSVTYDKGDSSYLISPCSREYDGTKLYRREWLVELRDIEFEGKIFLAPKNMDAVLKTLYNNYMTLPPVGERVSHHRFKAYIKE